MFRPDYPIRTERLTLRPIDPVGDVDAVHAYQSRADVCRYVPYSPRTRDEVAEVLSSSRVRSVFEIPGHVITLGIVRQDTDELVGDIILVWQSKDDARGEIGYVLNPDHHGHGFATEASDAMLRYAFDEMRLHRVIARIDERNTASAAVLERLGMRAEARLVENEWFKGEWTTEIDYAILDREWRARS